MPHRDRSRGWCVEEDGHCIQCFRSSSAKWEYVRAGQCRCSLRRKFARSFDDDFYNEIPYYRVLVIRYRRDVHDNSKYNSQVISIDGNQNRILPLASSPLENHVRGRIYVAALPASRVDCRNLRLPRSYLS